MANGITAKKQNILLETLVDELKEVKKQLRQFLVFLPAENLKGYKNAQQIKKAYLEAIKAFPPR